jgi:hypothetical protein
MNHFLKKVFFKKTLWKVKRAKQKQKRYYSNNKSRSYILKTQISSKCKIKTKEKLKRLNSMGIKEVMVREITIHLLNQVINQNIYLKTNLLAIKSKDKVQVTQEILKQSNKNRSMKENTCSYRKLDS